MQSITKELRDSDFLVSEFGEEDGETEFQRAVIRYHDRLQKYPDREVEGTVSVENIGPGADWYLISVSIASLFFGIPKVHKLVRESLQEWRRIYDETRSLLSWLASDRTIYYPDGHLFLIAVVELSQDPHLSDLTYLHCMRLPNDNPDFYGIEPLLFTFRSTDSMEQIAMARHGAILWRNTVHLSVDAHP